MFMPPFRICLGIMDNQEVREFFSVYEVQVQAHAMQLREVLHSLLPGITEQIDTSARIVAYSYGQRYTDMICVLIPSQKGLKLGFSRGVSLPDPEQILEGKGKISRYVVIRAAEQITSTAVTNLILAGLQEYKKLMKEV